MGALNIMNFDNVQEIHSNVDGRTMAAFGLDASTHSKATLASLGTSITNGEGFANPNFDKSAKGLKF